MPKATTTKTATATATKSKKATGSAAGAAKTKRKPSPYNLFMKDELKKVKQHNPGLDHKQAFKTAAQNWKTSPENPINKK